MSDARSFRVDSREALDHVTSARTLVRLMLPKIEIANPSLDTHATHELQERVDTLVDACGCAEGSAGVLVSLATYVTYAATLGPSHGAVGYTWRTVFVMFLGALLGKLLGLTRARIALRRVLVEARALFPEAPMLQAEPHR